jgi:transcriptional regulator with XRE-family HTH domain
MPTRSPISPPSQLETARRLAGLSLSDAARKTGLSRSTISEVERGIRPATPVVRATLEACYGVEIFSRGAGA